MELLTRTITRHSYIFWTLGILCVRFLAAAPVLVAFYRAGVFSPFLYALTVTANIITLALLLIVNSRRLSTLEAPRALALLTLLPFVKFALILYLSLVPFPTSEGGATDATEATETEAASTAQ